MSMDVDIAALYVDAEGPYAGVEGIDAWTIDRDARGYDGPGAVVAHPPCADWSRLSCFARNDPDRKSCGPRAVEQVREFGGVLEHPAFSKLWPACDMPRPWSLGVLGRSLPDRHGGWTLAVEQVSWGHPARKQTWLYIVGVRARDLDPAEGGSPTHVVSALGKARRARARKPQLPEMPKAERHLTPPAFAKFLADIARAADK